MTDTTKIDIPPERKQAYDFIDANPSMPQSERLIKFAALARKQERLECAKLSCHYCQTVDRWSLAEKDEFGDWIHRSTGAVNCEAGCDAAAIHERNLAETGGTK